MDETTRASRARLDRDRSADFVSGAVHWPAPDWLVALCPDHLRNGSRARVREGEIVLVLGERRPGAARSTLADYEAGFAGRQVPDAAHAAIAELTRAAVIGDLSAHMIELRESVGVADGGD